MAVNILKEASNGLVNIKLFRGEEINADFKRWVKTTSRTLDAAGIEKEEQRVKLILTYMEGKAGLARDSYYAELDNDNPKVSEIKTVAGMIEYFAPTFKQENAELNLRQRLLDLKQTGSLQEYIQKEELIVGSSSFEGKWERAFLFINGLKKEILKAVIDRAPKDFEDAKKHALDYITKEETTSSMVKSAQPEYMDIDTIKVKPIETTENLSYVRTDQRQQSIPTRMKEKNTLQQTDYVSSAEEAVIWLTSASQKPKVPCLWVDKEPLLLCTRKNNTSNSGNLEWRRTKNKILEDEIDSSTSQSSIDDSTDNNWADKEYESDGRVNELLERTENLRLSDDEDQKMVDFEEIFENMYEVGNQNTDNRPMNSGATTSFISNELSKKLGLIEEPSTPVKARMANGVITTCDKMVNTEITFGEEKGLISG
ncbi:hypothetical protein AX774_g3638 [Zancudomyces culisetae]|uniref:Retrotransposon gag domain-containing protein n=2 Tax=Zancudomyces culisetae TaxID=1213189 RepID=A0A1R1PPK6_ZANCU|nr:hypothetical protein AX774_g3638 [Zancudomyces culisetae]|eukprot:OMH82871.1 hypothetical protein AX774_g3638 [Zancudomyces culisetae]